MVFGPMNKNSITVDVYICIRNVTIFIVPVEEESPGEERDEAKQQSESDRAISAPNFDG